jgi:glucokinase
VAEAGELLFEGVRREVAARTMPSMLGDVRIEAAYRGNFCGMIGAALQIWEYGAPANSSLSEASFNSLD